MLISRTQNVLKISNNYNQNLFPFLNQTLHFTLAFTNSLIFTKQVSFPLEVRIIGSPLILISNQSVLSLLASWAWCSDDTWFDWIESNKGNPIRSADFQIPCNRCIFKWWCDWTSFVRFYPNKSLCPHSHLFLMRQAHPVGLRDKWLNLGMRMDSHCIWILFLYQAFLLILAIPIVPVVVVCILVSCGKCFSSSSVGGSACGLQRHIGKS